MSTGLTPLEPEPSGRAACALIVIAPPVQPHLSAFQTGSHSTGSLRTSLNIDIMLPLPPKQGSQASTSISGLEKHFILDF